MPWPDWLLMPNGVAFCELWHCEGLANGILEFLNALKSRMLWLHWLVKLPRGLAEVLGSFDGWQTALLNALRSRMPWPDWRLKLPKGVAVGLASVVCARCRDAGIARKK